MRAWLNENKEFMYADNGLQGLSTFYGVLFGYSISGKKFVIDQPTGIYDIEHNEVYENDNLQVVYKLTATEVRDGYIKVMTGKVRFDDGCFVVENEDLDYMDFLSNDGLDRYNFKIIGHGHN